MSIIPSDQVEEFNDFVDEQIKAIHNAKIIAKDDNWYYSDTGFVTNTHLKIIGKQGPKHLVDYYINGRPDTNAFSFGRACHCKLLEPEQFDERYYVLDDSEIKQEIGGARPTATNKYKEWIEDKKDFAQRKNLELLSIDDYKTICSMMDELKKIKEVDSLLKMTVKETILSNTIADVPCKIKVDAICSGSYIIDYKTCNEAATRENFMRDMFSYGYDHQAAFYCDVAKVEDFYFIVQEKNFPYSIMIAKVSGETLEKGREKYQKNLLTYRKYFNNKRIEDTMKELNNFYLKTTV